MSQKYVILVRHGAYHQLADTPSAHQPFALSGEGFEQAKAGAGALAKLIADLGCSLHPMIHSSNLLRAWQTAVALKQEFDELKDIHGYDELAERGLGSAANLTVSQIEKIIADDPRFAPPPANWKSNSHYRLPLQGAESLMEAGARVARHLNQTASHLDDGQARLIVGHGASLRHGAHHLGVLTFEEIAKLSMYHAQPVALGLDDQGQWHHAGGNWKVRKKTDVALD